MGYNTCPCCGKRTIERLGEYEICPICHREDVPVQSADPHFSGGANSMSLEDAKKLYLSKKD